MTKRDLLEYYIAYKEAKRNIKIQKKKDFAASRIEAEIIRYVHAIEKGLSLEKPRLGFGLKKINCLFSYIEEYKKLNIEDTMCLFMARDVIIAYLEFHKNKGYTSEAIEKVSEKQAFLFSNLPNDGVSYGGVLTLNKDELSYSLDEIEKLFRTRHSIREFSGESVADEDIRKAIALAQTCPSACNRQCTRVYSISVKKYMQDMGTDLQGIGGFADDADRFLLVTAKQSAYEIDERNQYIVSAAMFAGYLSLALQAYRIAACTVQRSVLPNKRWDNFKRINGIADDEQIVVMFAIGKFKDITKVPVSKRFALDKVFRELKDEE